MMPFLEEADASWAAELKDAGLLPPDVVDRIDQALGRPESGTLNEFLLAGSEWISERAWLSWLIRRHGCHRYGRVCWTEDASAWARDGAPAEGNLPYLSCPGGALLFATLRPDLRDGTRRRFPGFEPHWAAATPVEIRDLHAAWRRAERPKLDH